MAAAAIAPGQEPPRLRLAIRAAADTITVGDSLLVKFRVENLSPKWTRAFVPLTADVNHVFLSMVDADGESAVILGSNWHTGEYPLQELREFETTIPGDGFIGWRVLFGTVRGVPGRYRLFAALKAVDSSSGRLIGLVDSASVVVRPAQR